ncbi:hypothetical protein SO694_00022261 [Aureococcus anophagefferens]|uniref:Uncharacterized protein n=1 Tax=Aureococcus anophagefferens TaxID=44056 RepID=A0ABR1FTE4_AURAN
MAAAAKAALLFIATIRAFAPRINTPVKKHAPLFAKPTEVHYALNAELSKEQSPAKLVALVEERSQDFNGVNMATALRRLATAPLGRQPRARAAGLVAARLETSLAERPDDFGARVRRDRVLGLREARPRRARRARPRRRGPRGAHGAARARDDGLGAARRPRADADAKADGGYAAARRWRDRGGAEGRGGRRDAPGQGPLRARRVDGRLRAATPRSKAGPTATRRARRLGGPAVAGAGSWNGQDVANAAWAYASAREPAPRLFGAFFGSLANVAWAVAALYADGGGLDDAGRALGLDAVLAAVADAAVPARGRFGAARAGSSRRRCAPSPPCAPTRPSPRSWARWAAPRRRTRARCRPRRGDGRDASPLRRLPGNADAVVAALADDAADRAATFGAQEREDLCRALAVCGFADHALFGAAAEAVFPRVADDAKLLPVPTTAYAANDTDRVTVLEVVPYDAMFLAPLGGGPGGDAGAPRRDDPIRELHVPPQNADVASL